MPSPFKTKEVTPVQKLAYYWTRLDDQTKGYFEQLYKKYPQDVSEVLAGEALLPAPNCPTLQDWVDGKGGGEALSFSDFEHVYIQIEELKSEPEQVDAGEKFKVVWTGEAKSDFPAREDTLVFMDIRSSEEVRTLTLTYPEIKAGAVKEEIDCGPLPDGSYMATLTVNVDGSEHGSELTAQGIRNVAQVDVHVGESEEAFRARLAPVIVAIQRQANTAFMGDSGRGELGPQTSQAIKDMARLVADVDRPGREQTAGPRTEVASAIYDRAENLPVFNQVLDDLGTAWGPLRDRLQGMMSRNANVDDVPAFQGEVLAWLNEYSQVVRYGG